jgi:homoserine dehydrogenase
MGQKVHPYGFRLGITTDHRSQWFSDSSKPGERYSDYVAEDITLRRFLQEKLDRAGVSHMVIRRTRDRVTVDVHVARPGVAIGRQGTGLDKLRDDARVLTGKVVITGNKALLAEHGQEIFRLAREKRVPVFYEAAVAGGIPIIKIVRESFVGNRFESIHGILNGTSNYILSRMTDTGMDFAPALAEVLAQVPLPPA